MLKLPCFGLHWAEGGIAVLFQGNGATTALGFDVEVERLRKTRWCNHEIDINKVERIPDEIRNDPLVTALSPVPRPVGTRVPFFPTEQVNPALLKAMTQMSAPVKDTIFPLKFMHRDVLNMHLRASNIQPLVLVGFDPRYKQGMDTTLVVGAHMPRPMTMIGQPSMILRPEAERKYTELDERHIDLPWREYGAYLLREYMIDQANSSS